ncbi:MAG TPA: hypothetical protein VFU76_13205 [Terriglobales bacterium]|nr:hypothetical protein [Terriglobales bacterium]
MSRRARLLTVLLLLLVAAGVCGVFAGAETLAGVFRAAQAVMAASMLLAATCRLAEYGVDRATAWRAKLCRLRVAPQSASSLPSVLLC